MMGNTMGAGKWLAVLALVLIPIAMMGYLSPVYGFILIPIVSFGFILLGKPRLFIYVFLSISSVYPLIQSISAFAPFQYLNEVMALVLYAMFFGHFALRRLSISQVRPFFKLVVGFVAYCCLVYAINRGTSRGFMQFFFVYLPFVPVFFLVRDTFTDKDFGTLMKWTIVFFWVNFALNLGWWFHVNPLPNWQADRGNMVDHALGTFHGQTYMAYFCGMVIFLLTAAALKPQLFTKRQKRILFITLGAVFVQFYMTFTNHAYVFFAAAFIPFAFISKLWKQWYVLPGLIVALGVFVLVASRSEFVAYVVNEQSLEQRYDSLMYSPKVQLYQQLLVDNMKENPREWLIGVGPGNGMGHIGMDNRTPFALRMLLPYYSAADQSEMQITSITGNTYSGVFAIWGDLGFVGFVLFVLLHLYVLKAIRRIMLQSSDERNVVVAQFMIGTFIFWVIILLAFDCLQSVLPIWLWMWIGWLLRREGGVISSAPESLDNKNSLPENAVAQ